MSFECGQQRVMRSGWERPGSLASRWVLTNRMREFFTYGSVGGAGGNPGPYPAPNDEERGQPHVPIRASLARFSSSVSFAFGRRFGPFPASSAVKSIGSWTEGRWMATKATGRLRHGARFLFFRLPERS
jgi:hypothetical protein